MRLAVFASGTGSNFSALAQAIAQRQVPGEIVLLFCDQPSAEVVERGLKLGVTVESFSPKNFESRRAYELEILRLLYKYQVELIVLAGYMRVVGPDLLTAFPLKIVNIHPSLLPKYPGLHSIREAYEAGETETGVTIHYIDEGVDTGPIIIQKSVPIIPGESLETLTQRIHQVEHQLYPQVLSQIIAEQSQLKNKE